ncbi:MAG: 6-phosphofructokinase [Anaerolineae bacterium]|nr:6-phosphofructokinase [Anaerolineae bacterium]
MTDQPVSRIAVFTSGGDAPGMNAAVRAIVRTGIKLGLEVYAVYEGYQGLVDGGDFIRRMEWGSVGGILQRGGTEIGSARSADFRTREGRLKAAKNLVDKGIEALIVIGGDGSLTGANIFRQEWPELLADLVAQGLVTQKRVERYRNLKLVGLVGSIDNDMFGTDMTIGADTALHRIMQAVDAIASTAASHQRVFVIEVMGRHCGYLALMSAMATAANWVLIPECPPEGENWEENMSRALQAGRETGRRHSIVIVAEGAQDRDGNAITSQYVKEVLEERLGEDTRVTILGHVQRGGSPSAFDRNLGTLMGYAAVKRVIESAPDEEPQLIGIRENKLIHSPLMECVRKTQQVAQAIADKDYGQAMDLRGTSFADALRTFRTLVQANPSAPRPGQKHLRLLVMNCGGPAAGMNTAVRVAVRLGLDQGHTVLAARNGFRGLLREDIVEMDWMSVNGWVSRGGAELGTSRKIPYDHELPKIDQIFEKYDINGLLMIGGISGYESVYKLFSTSNTYPAFNIPIVCLPASINNNLPGSEHSIGSDTALNNIVQDVDKIKQSAVASRRCFVVEVMGRYCGYLALMSGMATGAERIYLHEEGVTLHDLQVDLENLVTGFEGDMRLGLIIRNESVDPFYTTEFIASLFEKEGGGLFDVRQTILGHVQQGGDPTPFDRIQATRMTVRCMDFLLQEADKVSPAGVFIGLQSGKMAFTSLGDLPRLVDREHNRPKDQWWLDRRPIARLLAQAEE